MKDNKKILLIICILIIILVIILVVMLNLLKEYNSSDNTNTEFEQQILYETNKNISKVENRNEYYVVDNIVATYMRYINNLKKEDKEDSDIAMYSILDQEYISEFNITENDIKEKFNIYTTNEKVYIEDMYQIELSASSNIFIVYGNTINTNENFQIMVKTDSSNNAFSIFSKEYMDKYNYSYESDVNSIKISDENIEPNNYNQFEYVNINDEQMAIYYFEDLKNRIFEENKLYNVLNVDYISKKFSSIEEFNIYLENLKQIIMQRNIVSYQINNQDGYTQYVLIDQNGKYYIFNETAVMDYTVILDTYTIDLPQFTEKYNESTDQEKVLLNIQKVFDAINDGDYRYVYNKLDSTFRQNNFPTETDFENYIKQNFYASNNFEFSNYKSSGNLHIYDISFTDKNNASSEKKTKNFIMQLKEGTDFVMSFNVQ